MAQIINWGTQPVDPGENLVISHLAQNLPAKFSIIPNIEVVDRLGAQRGQAFEYDLIIVAPHAIYVAEVKRWAGVIEGDDYDWVINGRARRPNPVRLANRKARILKSSLVREGPIYQLVWVEGCVIIADDKVELQLTGDCAERVFRYVDAPAFIQDANSVGQPIGSISGQQHNIIRAIKGNSKAKARSPLQFGSYVVLEPLTATLLATEYLARHSLLRDSPPYRLRVFQISPYLTADEIARRRETITRDFQALQAIGEHPNLLPVRDFFDHNGSYYVEVTDWSNEGTLRKIISTRNAPLTVQRKLDIALGLARGLAAAHRRNVLHRDVRPENVLIAWDGTPRLMNFDRARIARAGHETIWANVAVDLDRTYLAPELDGPEPKALPASDLYSLGLIIFELLTGRLPYESLSAFLSLGGRLESVPGLLPTGLPNDLFKILSQLVVADLSARYASADALIADLERLGTNGSQDNASLPTTEVKERYDEKDLIGGMFRVLRVLGHGGLAHVYHVYHLIQDRDFALKIMNADVDLERLKMEFKAMSALNHPHIARAMWADRIAGGQYYLVTDFVEGETLKPYAEHKKRLSLPEILQIGTQLLDALEYMHPKQSLALQLRQEFGYDMTEEQFQQIQEAEHGVYHRDIKPANIILTRDGIKIIDFNIAAWSRSIPQGFMGTPSYVAPDWNLEKGYDASCDLFSAGVTLYELVTGKHPYSDELPSFSNAPQDPKQYIPELSQAFADYLLKAVAPFRDARFQSASEMRSALLSIGELTLSPQRRERDSLSDRGSINLASLINVSESEKIRPNYNPYLTRLLTLHSQARTDNSGTRGLDEIALATYVPTRLDNALRPAILAGEHRLVVISGNAGDGKTAFIQQVESEAARKGAIILPINDSQNGHKFTLDGLEFVTNYDGSQDESGRVNNDVLVDFFAPFSGSDPLRNAAKRVHVIAINEGRLRDFFASQTQRFKGLSEVITNYFSLEIPAEPPPGVLIVNLNWRSVVADGEMSIFTRQLRTLIDESLWVPCNSCAFRNRCPTIFNVDTLRDPISGPQVQERLRILFETVALRRQQHITMRDMRSALSYLLFRDRSCPEIISSLQGGYDPLEALAYYYYNGIASTAEPEQSDGDDENIEPIIERGHGDRLVRLLQQIDIALVSNPSDDREIHFDGPRALLLTEFEVRSDYEMQLIGTAFDSLPIGWVVAQDAELRDRHRKYHSMMRRKVFFERRDNWKRMLPFTELSLFQRATQSTVPTEQSSALDTLRRSLIVGISALEGCREPNLIEKYVCVRAGGTDKPTIKSFRLFTADNFYVVVPSVDGRYLEYLPDSLLLRHRAAAGLESYDAELRVTVDIFELLSHLERGYVPSVNDIQGAFVNLLIFRNALARLDYREVLLVAEDGATYRASIDAQNVIVLTKSQDVNAIIDA